MSHCHPHVHGTRWEPEPRCSGCGHRVMRRGVAPTRTRDLPFRFWIFELISRAEARLRRRYL